MSKMANCKACGKEIAKGVKKCPNCGKDNRNFFMKHKILTGLGVIIVIAILANIGGSKTPSTTTAGNNAPAKQEQKAVETIKVSASDFLKAYEDNEVSADKQYKGKVVEITGKVSDIGVMLNQTFVNVGTGADFEVSTAQCFFDDKAEIDKVSKLKKGDTVTIIGTVDGKSMNVGINKCKIK